MTVAEGNVQENPPLFQAWLDRYEAIGRAQHRYLYLLLVLVAFFLVIDGGPGSVPPITSKPLRLEFITLEVSRVLVWALGPSIISFVLLAFLGTFPAADAALHGLKSTAPAGLSGDVYDRVPNLIDFAMYTKGEGAVFIRLLTLSSYPFFATIVFLTAVYLTIRICAQPALGCGRWAVALVALALWVAVVLRLSRLWKGKVKSALKIK